MAPIDALLNNERSPIRKSAQAAMVMLAVVDSMVDEVYPLLDLYGDTIEGLEFMMMKADEPTMTHVALSYKVRKLVNSLRRCAAASPGATLPFRTLLLSVVACRSLWIYTLALLSLLPFSAKMTVSPPATVRRACAGRLRGPLASERSDHSAATAAAGAAAAAAAEVIL